MQNLFKQVKIMCLRTEDFMAFAVVQFARETGDLPFLSIADVKILALTFYLEKRIYGTAHLSMNPVILVKLFFIAYRTLDA